MSEHHNPFAAGIIGLLASVVTWYLNHVQIINGVLQTGLLLLSFLAVFLSWRSKRRLL